MADVHTFNPPPGDIARVVRGEALVRLNGDSAIFRTVQECLAAAFSTSGKDRPIMGPLQDTALVVLLAEAVAKLSDEVVALRKELAATKKHTSDLDARTIDSVVFGPGLRSDPRDGAKREAAKDELKARLEANPDWVAAREKFNADLAERRRVRDALRDAAAPPEAPPMPPPDPYGGLGE